MSQILKFLTFACFVGFNGAALAQDTATAEETPPATEGETPDTAANDDNPLDLSMGEEVDGPGTTYTRETHGNWELRCIRVPEGQQEPCQLYQLLKDDAGNGLAEINLFNLPEGQQAAAGATIVTPLETLLTQQLTLAVDGGPTKRYPFTFCSVQGCFARIGFSNGDLASFKRGANGTVTIVPFAAPDQKVVLNISLTGFTKGYEAVTIANTPIVKITPEQPEASE